MAAQRAGNTVADNFSLSPAEQALANNYFNQGSVNNGTLGTELGQGQFSSSSSAFDVDPLFGFDPDLSINLSGANALNNTQNPNAPRGSSQPVGGAPAPAKAKKIADIKTQLLKPATTSHYICRFFANESVNNWQKQRESSGYAGADYRNVNIGELIELLCSDASLPGSTLATHDINNDFHGMTQKNAYRRLYDDRADFTFYLDRNYTPLRYFEGWISYIVNEQIGGGNGLPRFTDPSFFYRVNYPKNYKCDEIYITKFEKDAGRADAGPTLEYRFFEAFPISISSMPVSYEASQLLKCTVSFTFSKYLINYKRPSAPTKSSTSPVAQNAPGVPELNNTINRPTVQSQIDEIKNMQEASRLRQAGYSVGLGQEGRYGPGF